MTSQEQDLLTRVARAMQASKAWPAVFDAGMEGDGIGSMYRAMIAGSLKGEG